VRDFDGADLQRLSHPILKRRRPPFGSELSLCLAFASFHSLSKYSANLSMSLATVAAMNTSTAQHPHAAKAIVAMIVSASMVVMVSVLAAASW
jgi:hypothetical protein